MKILNLQHRGVDRTTDILSFPQFSAEKLKARRAEVRTSGPQSFRTSELLLGDIVINLTRARRQAAENGLTLNEELKRLVIHGLLHLIGHDHEKSRYQKNKMELKERELLEKLRYH